MLESLQVHSDIILSVCSIIFSLSLFPTVYYNYKNHLCEIPFSTSLPTFFGMSMVTMVYIANNFHLATIVGSMTTLAWLTIAVQKYKYFHLIPCYIVPNGVYRK